MMNCPSPRDACLGWDWGMWTSTHNLHAYMYPYTFITHNLTTYSRPLPTLPHAPMCTVSSSIRIHRNCTFPLPLQCYTTRYILTRKLYFHSHYTFPCMCTCKVLHEQLLILHCTFSLIPPHSLTSSIHYTPHRHSCTHPHTTCLYYFSYLSRGQKVRLSSNDNDSKKGPRKVTLS